LNGILGLEKFVKPRTYIFLFSIDVEPSFIVLPPSEESVPQFPSPFAKRLNSSEEICPATTHLSDN